MLNRRTSVELLFATVVALCLQGNAFSSEMEERVNVATVAGTLQIEAKIEDEPSVPEFTLRIAGKQVASYHAVSVDVALRKRSRDGTTEFIVLEIPTGGSGCEVFYRVIQLWRDGRNAISHQIGNCLHYTSAVTRNHTLRLSFPSTRRPRHLDKWIVKDGVATGPQGP